MTHPRPGLHENVSFEDYLAWDAVSSSLFAKSPAHYQAGYQTASKQMALGSVIHACVLEGGLENRYVVVPNFHTQNGNVDAKGKPSHSKATTWYKERVLEFVHGFPPEVEICSQETYDKAKGVYDAIQNHGRASMLLDDGIVEASIVWNDSATSLTCKGRIDLLGGSHFVDLKTTSSCATFNISRYNYHRQMAWYRHGLQVLTGEEFTPYIVCCECDPPYPVMAAPLSELALMEGWDECEELLNGLSACMFTDSWPGVESPEEWELPE